MKKSQIILLKKIFLIIGIVAGILAFVMFCLSTGVYVPNEVYTGDAYTGIQNAAARTAHNAKCVALILKLGFGFLFAIISSFLICVSSFLNTFIKNEKVDSNDYQKLHNQQINNNQ